MLLSDLITGITRVYEAAGIQVTEPIPEAEGSEYGACRFKLEKSSVVFRVAKTTPTKRGHFVTMWKRLEPGSSIRPFDVDDTIDFLVIAVSDTTHSGQFVFDKKILIEKGLMSSKDKIGKLAFRLYAPWSNPIAKAAIKTQQWQLPYFFSMSSKGIAEPHQIRKLFNLQFNF